MTNRTTRSALVTGATSGLGLEAAAQLAQAGFSPVTITGRTKQKVEAAHSQLVVRTGKKVFETLLIDLDSPASVKQGGAKLAARGRQVDVLLLNAGMASGSEVRRTPAGIETTFSASLVGHHQLTMNLLASDSLSTSARIIIAGSEAARGDVPTMSVVDLPELAKSSFDGDLESAAESLILGSGATKHKPMNTYANAKLFVAWWAASLARKLPSGMTVNAVSPGSAPDTGMARSAPFFMRRVMIPIMAKAPARLGLAASVPVAARRYVDAADFGANVTGQFFASAPKKMTGRLHRVELPRVLDRASQDAAWSATVKTSGVAYPLEPTTSPGTTNGRASDARDAVPAA